MNAVAGEHPDLVWDFALAHSSQLCPLMASQALLSMMPAIAGSSYDPKRIADLQAYADQNLAVSARQNVERAIATIRQNAKFRAERLSEIDAWLASKAPN